VAVHVGVTVLVAFGVNVAVCLQVGVGVRVAVPVDVAVAVGLPGPVKVGGTWTWARTSATWDSKAAKKTAGISAASARTGMASSRYRIAAS
jgi:hypothetical protein